jgi:hypothetical protein
MMGIIGVVILAAILAVAWFMYSKNRKAWEVAAGAPVEE